MHMFFGGTKRLIAWFALILLGVAWWQHAPLLAWYYVSKLAGAEETNREAWVKRVVTLDEAALPRLFAGLESADERICENMEAALVALGGNWGADDPRSVTLVTELKFRFPNFPVSGKNSALRIPAAILQKTPPEKKAPAHLLRDAGDMLVAAVPNAELRLSSLLLAGVLIEHAAQGQWHDVCRNLALDGLNDAQPATRVAAVRLVLRAPFRKDTDMLTKVTPLLRDQAASVRLAALLALASARDVASDDDLLPLLHDPDAEVQERCETALRSRGLEDDHLRLARLISDDSPAARLQVLQHLRHATDLDPGVWLRRLSNDSAPAVRAAAVRAAVLQDQTDLRDRLAEMSLQDPSPTVRELAGYYLQRAKKLTP